MEGHLRSAVEFLRKTRLWHVFIVINHIVHIFFLPVSLLRNFFGERIHLHIESVWPSITGTLSAKRSSGSWEPLTIRYGTTSVRFPLESIRVAADEIEGSRRLVRFTINYPLAFGVFRPEKVRVTYKSRRSDIKRAIRKDPGLVGRLVEPAEIVTKGIRSVRSTLKGRSVPDFRGEVAIVSVYSDSNRGIEPATQLLRDLRDAGIFTIVVDTSEHPHTPESTPGDLYVHRRNEGWDFASWFSVLMRWPEITARADRLLLTNDSNYGPLRPLAGIMTEGRALGANVWGITDSWAIAYHLQSYFLEFDSATLRSGVIQDFIADFPFAVVKDDVVRGGEIALTNYLSNRGFSLKPLIPYERITDRLLANFEQTVDSILELPENQLQLNLGRSQDIYELAFLLDVVDSIRMSVPLDPTLHLWDTLLQLGGPFIKRKLVLSREGGFPGVERLPTLVPPGTQLEAIRAEAPHRFIGRSN